ncbi:hypothetical protein SNE40_013458 [Patella caerulea]|uniref:RWD domain-containing protein n=2 Tax=Patella caerulea TaxID=87958 RepID=A0AAN8PNM5_PATCE
MSELQEEEVASIKEEFKGRCRVVEKGSDVYSRSVTIQPKDMDLTIKFQLPTSYPKTAPKISIRAECMEEDDVLELQELLQSRTNVYLNNPMMKSLTNEAETWLKANGLGKSKKSPKGNKHKKKQKKPREDKVTVEKLASMKTADDVVKRIQWDSDLPQEDFLVGYLDRFLGIKEKYFTAFSWEDIASVDYNVLAIPKHRIQYFKYRDIKVWDKLTRLDNVFGSLGSGTKITDIIANYDQELDKWKTEKATELPSTDSNEKVDDDDSDSDSDSDDGIIVTIGTNTANPMSSHPGYWQDKLRPNYFLAIRVTDSAVQEVTSEIQDNILANQPLYRECCIPPSALHVTLCTLGLDTQEQVDSACRVLKSIRDELKDAVPAQPLVLNGVSNFYSRVVYAKIEYPDGFLDFVDQLSMCLRHEGIEIRDQHEFIPHMTIMKTSRPVSRRMGTANIDKRLYEQFTDKYLGEVNISGVYLCSMGDERQADGFYISPANIKF